MYRPIINPNLTHMSPLLRRISITLFSSSLRSLTSHNSPIKMDSSKNHGPFNRLMVLAHQLCSYTPPPMSPEDEDDDDGRTEKAVSQLGFAESATSAAEQRHRISPRRAAVLVCLFEGDGGEFRVILTQRSSSLSTHSGEVSLPGGKADETDTNDAETATREAKEEIGLEPSLVKIVTCLEPFLSKHLLRVIPVIGILTDKKGFTPCPNPAEVEAVFDAPLEMFLKDDNRRFEEREWMGRKYLVHFFEYETNETACFC